MLIALSLASALAVAEAAAAKPELAECDHAFPDKPTIDSRRLPGARFRIVNEPIGFDTRNGRKVDVYFPKAVETATLKSGANVRVEQDGCESAATSYIFELRGEAHALSDGRYWFERAIVLIDEVAAVSRPGAVRFDALKAKLKADLRERPNYDFGKGELMDEITFPDEGHAVSVSRKHDAAYLTVSYFIPL